MDLPPADRALPTRARWPSSFVSRVTARNAIDRLVGKGSSVQARLTGQLHRAAAGQPLTHCPAFRKECTSAAGAGLALDLASRFSRRRPDERLSAANSSPANGRAAGAACAWPTTVMAYEDQRAAGLGAMDAGRCSGLAQPQPLRHTGVARRCSIRASMPTLGSPGCSNAGGRGGALYIPRGLRPDGPGGRTRRIRIAAATTTTCRRNARRK